MLKTILSFLAPTLLLAMGQIAAVALGLAILWVAKRRGYGFGGLASLDLLPKSLSGLWDGPGEKELRIIQTLALALIVAGVTVFFTTEAGTFWHDLWPEMISTGGAVLGIDELNRRRSAQEYKRGIIRQMRSQSNDFALDAARIAQEENWLYDGSLERANLYIANLAGADLVLAKIEGVNLYNSNLAGANLQSANLRGAKLQYANLRGVNLEYAKIEGTNLWGANLEEANLANAKLEGASLYIANLAGANLVEANLAGALYKDSTIWPKGFDPKAKGAVNRDELSKEELEEWIAKYRPEESRALPIITY